MFRQIFICIIIFTQVHCSFMYIFFLSGLMSHITAVQHNSIHKTFHSCAVNTLGSFTSLTFPFAEVFRCCWEDVCVCVSGWALCYSRQPSCQQGGVKRPEGFEHSHPAKHTVCPDNGMVPSPSTCIPPSRPRPKKSQQRGGLLPALLHSCQRVSFLFSLYLFPPLSAIISPPPFSPSRRIHPPPPPCRATPLPSVSSHSPPGEISIITLLPFSLHCRLHPAFRPSLHLYLTSHDTPLTPPPFLALHLCLPLRPSAFNLWSFSFLGKQTVYALANELLIRMQTFIHEILVCIGKSSI